MIRGLIACVLIAVSAARAWAIDDAAYFAAATAAAREEIIPTYRGLKDSTAHLPPAFRNLCVDPSESNLKIARRWFVQTALFWARVQFITSGPVADHQRAFRMEYWPDKRNVVGRQLNDVLTKQDPAALESERFATTSVGVQGLPALERLLFDDDALTKLALDAPGRAYRCDLLAAIARNLDTIAEEILVGWTPEQVRFLGGQPSNENGTMPTGRDVAGHLLNDLLTATIAMRDMKLLAPLGASLEKAKPQAAEYWRSGQSLRALEYNLTSLRGAIAAKNGLADLLTQQPDGLSTSRAIVDAVDEAHAMVVRIGSKSAAGTDLSPPLPLDKAVADPDQRKQVEAFAAQLVKIRDLLAGPVATKLNLPIGFNALDGD